MVYFYTNYAAETNAWWLRRVRPVWMTALALGLGALGYRYHYFGKIQTNIHEKTP